MFWVSFWNHFATFLVSFWNVSGNMSGYPVANLRGNGRSHGATPWQWLFPRGAPVAMGSPTGDLRGNGRSHGVPPWQQAFPRDSPVAMAAALGNDNQ